MKGHRLFNNQMNWLLQYWMRYHISINCTQCLVNLLSKDIWGSRKRTNPIVYWTCKLEKTVTFDWIVISHPFQWNICMSTIKKTSSCPLFSCYYEFTASVCWAGVMIMHGTTRWYTKLVLTTGSLVDSLPPDHHIYHTTHITQNSSPPR